MILADLSLQKFFFKCFTFIYCLSPADVLIKRYLQLRVDLLPKVIEVMTLVIPVVRFCLFLLPGPFSLCVLSIFFIFILQSFGVWTLSVFLDVLSKRDLCVTAPLHSLEKAVITTHACQYKTDVFPKKHRCGTTIPTSARVFKMMPSLPFNDGHYRTTLAGNTA